MDSFFKVVRLGTARSPNGRDYSIFCKVSYVGGRLSIQGVEGPLPSGNCIGSCGQIIMDLTPEEITPAPGWTTERIRWFLDAWRRWHLNDRRAGSPAQTALLREAPGRRVYKEDKQLLAEAGLDPDPGCLHEGKPYAYGTRWLTEEVPEAVLAKLSALPDTDIAPAWV